MICSNHPARVVRPWVELTEIAPPCAHHCGERTLSRRGSPLSPTWDTHRRPFVSLVGDGWPGRRQGADRCGMLMPFDRTGEHSPVQTYLSICVGAVCEARSVVGLLQRRDCPSAPASRVLRSAHSWHSLPSAIAADADTSGRRRYSSCKSTVPAIEVPPSWSMAKRRSRTVERRARRAKTTASAASAMRLTSAEPRTGGASTTMWS